jgi:hypothetical protein
MTRREGQAPALSRAMTYDSYHPESASRAPMSLTK